MKDYCDDKITDERLCEVANMKRFKKDQRIITIKSMARCGNPCRCNLREKLIEAIKSIDSSVFI